MDDATPKLTGSFPELMGNLLLSMTEAERNAVQEALPACESVLRLMWQFAAAADTEAFRVAVVREATETLRRAGFQSHFRNLLASDPNVKQRVLDIGCGGALPECVSFLRDVSRQLDGVDPSPAVLKHPHLTQRWHSTFEDADIPAATYDLAYAYNVVEHVPIARPFFAKLANVLRPGGTFWALTPNVRHPFTWLSRGLELVGIKSVLARHKEGINDYPAYYRLNSPRQIRKAIAGLPLYKPSFHYFGASWEAGYFPASLQWAPRLYDRVIADPNPSLRVIAIMRLQRSWSS